MTLYNRLKHFFIKHNLSDFKTRNHKLAIVAMIINFGSAAFKIIAAFYISSYFLVVSSFYSLGIGLTLQLFFRGVNQSKLVQTKEKKYVILIYMGLLISSIIYSFYMIRLFYIEVTEFNYGMLVSLGIAVVSFVELGIAIRGLVKSYHLRDSLLTARKTVTLTNAMVALVVTQSAIMTFATNDGSSYQMYSAISGISVGIMAILISSIMLVRHLLMKHTPLDQMTMEELWELFPIFLVTHKNSWSRRFAKEKRYLLNHVSRQYIKKIEHIGSTAINDIKAKNIIDILIVVSKKQDLQTVAQKLIKLNYSITSESSYRVTLHKGYTKHGFAKDVFHIHLRLKNDCDEIYFRDYMNAHPELAKTYESLKIDMADMHRNNPDAYADAKSDFVNRIVKLAKSTHQ